MNIVIDLCFIFFIFMVGVCVGMKIINDQWDKVRAEGAKTKAPLGKPEEVDVGYRDSAGPVNIVDNIELIPEPLPLKPEIKIVKRRRLKTEIKEQCVRCKSIFMVPVNLYTPKHGQMYYKCPVCNKEELTIEDLYEDEPKPSIKGQPLCL